MFLNKKKYIRKISTTALEISVLRAVRVANVLLVSYSPQHVYLSYRCPCAVGTSGVSKPQGYGFDSQDPRFLATCWNVPGRNTEPSETKMQPTVHIHLTNVVLPHTNKQWVMFLSYWCHFIWDGRRWEKCCPVSSRLCKKMMSPFLIPRRRLSGWLEKSYRRELTYMGQRDKEHWVSNIFIATFFQFSFFFSNNIFLNNISNKLQTSRWPFTLELLCLWVVPLCPVTGDPVTPLTSEETNRH